MEVERVENGSVARLDLPTMYAQSTASVGKEFGSGGFELVLVYFKLHLTKSTVFFRAMLKSANATSVNRVFIRGPFLGLLFGEAG